jgi:hypothetical protein
LSDKRRTPYVPLDSFVAFKRTGQTLKKKWGMEGLCTWMLFLAACKRDIVPGTLTYSSDEEAWAKLGALATRFTLDEFFAVTGRLRQTRKRRLGHVTSVECSNWDTWVTDYRRQQQTDWQRGNRAPSEGANAFSEPQVTTPRLQGRVGNPRKQEDSTVHGLSTMTTPKQKQKQKRSKGSTRAQADPVDNSDETAKKKINEHHLKRLLDVLPDKDDRTEATIRKMFGGLPDAAFEEARERVTENGVRSPTKLAVHVGKELRVRYVLGAA